MANLIEKNGFFSPEKHFKKLFLYSLIATLLTCLFLYLDYQHSKKTEFSKLVITEGTLVKGFNTAILKAENRAIYFPLRSRYHSYYRIRFEEFYNQKVKIWWYSSIPNKSLYGGNRIYQMQIKDDVVLTYEEQKKILSRQSHLISILSPAIAILLFLFGLVGYISSKDSKPIR